jgi:hypothetical protein
LIFRNLVFLKILFEFETGETFKTIDVMIHPEGWGILSHGRDVFEIIEKILVKFHLDVIELLNALALIHKGLFLGIGGKNRN